MTMEEAGYWTVMVALVGFMVWAMVWSPYRLTQSQEAEEKAACEVWRIRAERCGFCNDALDRRPRACSPRPEGAL